MPPFVDDEATGELVFVALSVASIALAVKTGGVTFAGSSPTER